MPANERVSIEVGGPAEPPLPGSSLIGAVLFPVFAIGGLVLGIVYSMPWLITMSLAIGLALAAVVAGAFLNHRGRSGMLRLQLSEGSTRIGPSPLARVLPLVANALAMLVILADIGLRLAGYFKDENGLSFSILIALVIAWGLFDSWHGLKNPQGIKLTPTLLETIAGMGKTSPIQWAQVTGPASVRGARLVIPVGKGEALVPITAIDSDPSAVIKLIEAYRRSPARRPELGDGRVVQRAQQLS